MSLIAPRASGGRWIVVPESYERLATSSFRRGQQLRKRIFIGLLAAAATTGVLAVFAGGGMWEVHLAVDASLAVYVGLLLGAKRRRREQEMKLRSLESRRRDHETVTFHEPVRASGGRQS